MFLDTWIMWRIWYTADTGVHICRNVPLSLYIMCTLMANNTKAKTSILTSGDKAVIHSQQKKSGGFFSSWSCSRKARRRRLRLKTQLSFLVPFSIHHQKEVLIFRLCSQWILTILPAYICSTNAYMCSTYILATQSFQLRIEATEPLKLFQNGGGGQNGGWNW